MISQLHRTPRWAVPITALVLAAAAGCGGDDDSAVDDAADPAESDATMQATATEPPSEPAPTATEPAQVDLTTFCESFLGIERAFAEMPEDEASIQAFVEERIEPNLEVIEGSGPESIADEVAVLTSAVREVVSTGDFGAFATPEYSAASQAVYTSLDEHCDVEVVEFDAVDFDYEGIPDTLQPGPTAFVMTNASEAGEAHEFSLVRLRDDTDASIEDLLSLPESEAEAHIDTFAGGLFGPAGSTSGTVVDLTPGRWAYVCFIPIGSVDGQDGSGPPHFTGGMAGEFRVEDGAGS